MPCLLASSLAFSSGAATYFVAPDGSDANPGTNASQPFQTIKRASRELQPGDTCQLRAGVYREVLTLMCSGTKAAPIVFEPYGNEVVTISGAEIVTGWSPWTNQTYQAQVETDLGNGYNQLFVDGEMAHQASYPNYGKAGLLHPATVSVSIESSAPNVISSPSFGGRAPNFWAGVWFSGAVGERWSWQCARVLSSSGNSITVETATRSKPWFTGTGVGLVWGQCNLLNGDDEWHLDGATRTLFLRTGLGGPMSHTVEMKRRNWCVDLNGRDYITIRGLHFRAGAVRLKGNGNILENCRARYLSHFMRYTWGYSFDGDRPEGGGVVLDGSDNVVRGCTLCDTAGSGIISSGAHNLLTRNLISNTDYSGTYGCSIRLNGCEHLVTFNTARNSGRDIIQPGGSGHGIYYNDLHHAGQMCRDLGVIYAWGVNSRSTNGHSTRIAFNWIHDHALSGPGPLVYLDNWTRFFVVDDNVLWNAPGDAGIRVNAPASGHQLYNNTLFNCDAIGTHTYNMWPANNPDPSFWKDNYYSYSAENNLFLGSSPETVLVDWVHKDFRPRLAAPGAYDAHGVPWVPGVNGFIRPELNIVPSGGRLALTAPPGVAAQYQLFSADSTDPLAVWSAVVQAPELSETQWKVTLPAQGRRFFRLQAR